MLVNHGLSKPCFALDFDKEAVVYYQRGGLWFGEGEGVFAWKRGVEDFFSWKLDVEVLFCSLSIH